MRIPTRGRRTRPWRIRRSEFRRAAPPSRIVRGLAAPGESRRKVRAHESAAPGNSRAFARPSAPKGAMEAAGDRKRHRKHTARGRQGSKQAVRERKRSNREAEGREAPSVRVKRRGKSPPRRRRRRRHGKPRCEQGRAVKGSSPESRPFRLRRAVARKGNCDVETRRVETNSRVGRADSTGNRRTRWMAAAPRGVQNPAYRPAFFYFADSRGVKVASRPFIDEIRSFVVQGGEALWRLCPYGILLQNP